MGEQGTGKCMMKHWCHHWKHYCSHKHTHSPLFSRSNRIANFRVWISSGQLEDRNRKVTRGLWETQHLFRSIVPWNKWGRSNKIGQMGQIRSYRTHFYITGISCATKWVLLDNMTKTHQNMSKRLNYPIYSFRGHFLKQNIAIVYSTFVTIEDLMFFS